MSGVEPIYITNNFVKSCSRSNIKCVDKGSKKFKIYSTVILVYNDHPSTGELKAEAVVDRCYLIGGRMERRVFKRMASKEKLFEFTQKF